MRGSGPVGVCPLRERAPVPQSQEDQDQQGAHVRQHCPSVCVILFMELEFIFHLFLHQPLKQEGAPLKPNIKFVRLIRWNKS